jgi:hypothetical protein
LSSSHTSDAGCILFGCQPNAWGAAQVFTNCSGCAALAVLASGFTSFILTESNGMNILKWELDKNSLSNIFYIERSSDGQKFYTIDSLRGTLIKNYTYTDRVPANGINYYRIRCVYMHSGQSITSKIISSEADQKRLKIYPSPFTNTFFIPIPGGEVVEKISVRTMSGNDIPITCRPAGHQWQVTLSSVSSKEILIVRVITNKNVMSEKIIRQ